jgi:hypothetical protein
MPEKSWVLTNTEDATYKEAFDAGGADYAVSKKTLRGGRQDGVDVITVDNGAMKFTVLPTRGMSLWRANVGDWDIGWKSPIRGPVHPNFVNVGEPSGLGWLDGFDEMLVRCGMESNGAPEFGDDGRLLYPLHGRLGNLPAHFVSVSIDEAEGVITVKGVVEESRFHFLKLRLTTEISTKVGSTTINIKDTVENLSASPAEAQMLYHFNVGAPTLDAGSTLVAPVKTLVPRNAHAASSIDTWNNYHAEQAGFEEQVYFAELHADADSRTEVLLKNAHGTRGISLQFDKRRLPCFSLWKDTSSIDDGYVTGIEPGTNFPNPRSYEGEHNRYVRLAPHGTITMGIDIVLHNEAAAVDAAEKAVQALQATPAQVFKTPQTGWCAP